MTLSLASTALKLKRPFINKDILRFTWWLYLLWLWHSWYGTPRARWLDSWIDGSAAVFDTMDHDIPADLMCSCAWGSRWTSFAYSLDGRTIKVTIGSENSAWKPVKFGVPLSLVVGLPLYILISPRLFPLFLDHGFTRMLMTCTRHRWFLSKFRPGCLQNGHGRRLILKDERRPATCFGITAWTPNRPCTRVHLIK